jgi:hypothetical protein
MQVRRREPRRGLEKPPGPRSLSPQARTGTSHRRSAYGTLCARWHELLDPAVDLRHRTRTRPRAAPSIRRWSAPPRRARSGTHRAQSPGSSGTAPRPPVRSTFRNPCSQASFGSATRAHSSVCAQSLPDRKAVTQRKNPAFAGLLFMRYRGARIEPGTSPTRITGARDPRQQEFPANRPFWSRPNGTSDSRILRPIPWDWAQKSRLCPIGGRADHWSQRMTLSYGGPPVLSSPAT